MKYWCFPSTVVQMDENPSLPRVQAGRGRRGKRRVRERRPAQEGREGARDPGRTREKLEVGAATHRMRSDRARECRRENRRGRSIKRIQKCETLKVEANFEGVFFSPNRPAINPSDPEGLHAIFLGKDPWSNQKGEAGGKKRSILRSAVQSLRSSFTSSETLASNSCSVRPSLLSTNRSGRSGTESGQKKR